MMLFTWSGSKIAPTAIVAMPTSLRMRSANGVWYMRAVDRPRLARRLARADVDQVGAGLLERRAISTASSGVLPPGAQSCAEMRTDIGRSAGQHARIARKTSSG